MTSSILTVNDATLALARASLERLSVLAQRQLDRLRSASCSGARLATLRGTGPGISLRTMVAALRTAYSPRLVSPFENSRFVGGAILRLDSLLGATRNDAFLWLRFRAGAVDLPMHAHLHSCRCLFVIGGRGFFHVSPQSLSTFDGKDVRSVAVRRRDVVAFRRGTMHTFSTADHALEMLSYHDPFVPLDNPGQYSLPAVCSLPGADGMNLSVELLCDPGWSILDAAPAREPGARTPTQAS